MEASVDILNHQNKHAPTPKVSRPYFDSSAYTYVTYTTQATVCFLKQSKTAAAFYLWRADTNFKWFSTVALLRPV